METRRNFLYGMATTLVGAGVSGSFFSSILGAANASDRFVAPKAGAANDLKDRNPKDVDPSELEVTQLKDFGSMGLDDHKADQGTWRLSIEGAVGKPLTLSRSELLALPAFERKVLLICPGFFANYGLWRGVSVNTLLKAAGVKKNVNYVAFSGPEGPYAKTTQAPMADVVSNKVFLAYEVNGKTLPIKHGFPLRLVAEDYYGYDWVKYVDNVTARVITS